jgi:hypothetical protein
VSEAGGAASSQQTGVLVGADWRVHCFTYGDRSPILAVHTGCSSVTFSVLSGPPDATALEFAREMARQAHAFAAEVERLHALTTADATGTTKAAASEAP